MDSCITSPRWPGHGEALAAAHLAGFDEDDVSADRRPHQPDRNARLLDALLHFLFEAELRNAQHFANHFRRDDELVRLAFGHAARLLADQRGDLAFETPHARLARVVVNQIVQRLVGELDLFAQREAMLLGLPRNQEPLRDMDLLLFGVSGQLEDLHAVAQRLGNRIEPVRGHHEDHLRQVKRHVEVVIAERRVLLRIEHFHQRRGRIAPEIAAELVHFVEHEDRVHGLGALDALNDLAGQRADVGAPVAADFRFVVHPAERNADELAAHGPRDRFSKRGLAHARRPDEAQDRALHPRLQLLHREVIEDALLHLHQVEVILVENLLGLGDVHLLVARAGGLVPRQRGHPFQVGPRNHVLGRSRSHLRQALELPLAFLLCVGRHAGLFDLLAQLFDFRLAVLGFAQLLLNGLHLLAQQEFALALVHLLLHLVVNLGAQLEDFLFFGKLVDQDFQPLADAECFKQLLTNHGVERRQRGGDEIREARRGVSMFAASVCKSSESCGERATTSRNNSWTLRSSAVNSASGWSSRSGCASTRARRNGLSPITSSTRMRPRPSRNATTLPFGMRTIL